MITLVLRFPGGHYHATPWGHHVNEGLVEWPPCPWRLLRALIATGYAKLGWSVVPETGRQLIEHLSDALPHYRLPMACVAHSRHYMPIGRMDKGTEKTTLVFDAWADVGDGRLAISWDVDLPDNERALLSELATTLSYVGRSETWIEARLLAEGESLPIGDESMPCNGVHHPGPGWEQVALLASLPSAEYSRWRQATVEPLPTSRTLPAGKKPPKKMVDQQAKIEEPYPIDLLACLQVDTAWLQQKGWSQPPGSRRIFYWRRTDALEVGPPQLVRKANPKPVESMLLALASPSGNTHALPSVTRTLPQAELLHRALVSAADPGSGIPCPAITGTSALGAPLKGHQHAHLLPLDLDGDGHLDHILVWAPMGLDPQAQDAVRAIRRTFTKGGIGDLRVLLAASGDLEDLRGLPDPLGIRLRNILGTKGGSTTWVSHTPFVPPRHMKSKGKNALFGQVAAELASRGMPAVATVEGVLSAESGSYCFRHWVRGRRDGPQPPVDCGFALRLRLGTPWPGPLCLGYGSHFGLGLFVAVEE